MRSAICSRWSESELRKAGPPMTLSIGMSLVRSPSSHAPYSLGYGVPAPEPAVEPGHHILPALVKDEEGVAVGGCDGGVDAVEEPVEAGPLVAPHVGLAEADVDDLHAADGAGGVLDDAQPCGEDFCSVPGGEPAVRAVDAGQLAPSGQQVAGVKLPVGRGRRSCPAARAASLGRGRAGRSTARRPRPGRFGRSSGGPSDSSM